MNESTENNGTPISGLLSWLRLLRVSALPSAVSNILMAYLLANQSWTPTFELGLLILASSALYLGGMVLNDVFDVDVDRVERPGRPLPAGSISLGAATWAGYGLLVAGVLLAGAAGWIGSHSAGLAWNSPLVRSALISILLAICIFLYDGPWKRTMLAPGLMGGCRILNILLGASTFIPLATNLDANTDHLIIGLPAVVWWVAISVGLLITGVTLFGRREAVQVQPRAPLLIAAVLIGGGLIGLALTAWCSTPFEIPPQTKKVFPLFIGIISLTIVRRVAEAVVTMEPKKIQMAVISVLRSLIIFDAAICYLTMPHQIGYAFAVLALLVPTILLSKTISST